MTPCIRVWESSLILLLWTINSETGTASAGLGQGTSTPLLTTASCDPSSKGCSSHSHETSTRIQQLKDSNRKQSSGDLPSVNMDEWANETDSSENEVHSSASTPSPEGSNGQQNKSRLLLRLPSLILQQRDFFSITERINALKKLFQSIVSLDRDLIWNPVVPSRMSRGSFLVKLFSKLLNIMPFHEVSKRRKRAERKTLSQLHHSGKCIQQMRGSGIRRTKDFVSLAHESGPKFWVQIRSFVMCIPSSQS